MSYDRTTFSKVFASLNSKDEKSYNGVCRTIKAMGPEVVEPSMIFLRAGIFLFLLLPGMLFAQTEFELEEKPELEASRVTLVHVDAILFKQATLNAQGKKVNVGHLLKIIARLDKQEFPDNVVKARALVSKVHAMCLLKRFGEANLLVSSKLPWLIKVEPKDSIRTYSALAGAYYFRAVSHIGLARKALADQKAPQAAASVRTALGALKKVKMYHMRTAYSLTVDDRLAEIRSDFLSNKSFSEGERKRFEKSLEDPVYRFSEIVNEAEDLFRAKKYSEAELKFQEALGFNIQSPENALILSHLVMAMVHNGTGGFDKHGRYTALDSVLDLLLKAHKDRPETAQCCLLAGDLYYLYAVGVIPSKRFAACAASFIWYELFFRLDPNHNKIPEIAYKMAEARNRLIAGLRVIRSKTKDLKQIKELDETIKIQLENNRRDYQRCADNDKDLERKKHASYQLAETFTELGGQGYVTAAVYYHYYYQLETDPDKLSFRLMAKLKGAEGLLKARVFTHAVASLETLLETLKLEGAGKADLKPIHEKALWMLVLGADKAAEFFANKVAKTTDRSKPIGENEDFKRYVAYKVTALGALDKFIRSYKGSSLGKGAVKKRAALVKQLDQLGYNLK